MPLLPSAETIIEDQAGAIADGLSYIAIIAPVGTSADSVPRVYANHDAILTQHGYADGVDYAALHIEETKKPVVFVGVPIATQGVVGRQNATGNTGTSVISLAPGANGVLGETEGVIKIKTGGTIGTSQIIFELSLDGGRTWSTVRLGTGNSYVIPRIGLTINFAAGTLVAGDTALTWNTSGPRWNAAGLTGARTALAAQSKSMRSWLIVGDLVTNQDAIDVYTEANAYDTVSDRYIYARAQVRDRLPLASMSKVQVRMTGNPNVTFAEVGATGDTITRSAGSFISDGFAVGDIITVSGSASNNFTSAAKITGVTATVITLDTDDLVAEGPVANVTITGTPSLTFAEVGATGDTITRNRGSWIDDGFRVGDKIIVSGTSSNNITAVAGLTAVTATVLTLDTDDLTAEIKGSFSVTITAGETKAQWISSVDSTFAATDNQKRIDLGAGKARKKSPILGYMFRRPVAWAASIREYQHDVHIANWRKADGPLSGWDLEDLNGNLAEFDERVDGGGLAARFTCFRSWGNGPRGPFIAMSLTRALEGSLLSRTHNMAVANLACTTVQAETENAVGQDLELASDGKATADSRKKIEERVNSQLELALLQNALGEGKRASRAVWVASTEDVLNVVGATMNGVLSLLLKGTLEQIKTKVRIQTAG